MFCKKCGKVIPEDSLFCQYCGEQLAETISSNKKERKGLLTRFQSLSKGWQICLMAYVCWVFFWIILCITEAIYDEDSRVICIVLFVFVLPVLALFAWYYFTHLRRKNNENVLPDRNPLKENHRLSEKPLDTEYQIYPLLKFAKAFGKMQVKVERDSDGILSSYCVFTNEKGEITLVDFSLTTSGLTAADISNKKDHLFVLQCPDSRYKLVEL